MSNEKGWEAIRRMQQVDDEQLAEFICTPTSRAECCVLAKEAIKALDTIDLAIDEAVRKCKEECNANRS